MCSTNNLSLLIIILQYGSSTEDYLKDGSTPIQRLTLCGDGVFPGESCLGLSRQYLTCTHILILNFLLALGIGVPAVALSGASAANAMISPWKQWICLDDLKAKKII